MKMYRLKIVNKIAGTVRYTTWLANKQLVEKKAVRLQNQNIYITVEEGERGEVR